MNLDTAIHIVEIVVLGAPLWYVTIRLVVIFREYPPHVHEYDRKGYPTIRYPRGYEPGTIQAIGGHYDKENGST